MEIVVTGRHVQMSERFRGQLEEKLGKVEQLAPRVQRLDVVVSHEANRRQVKACDKVEITCHVKGPVIRAEACADDKYAALDMAVDKLFERLRRMHDRRRVHRGRHVPESLAQATARVPEGAAPSAARGPNKDGASGRAAGADGSKGGGTLAQLQEESPIQVREKVHATAPMALDQALYEMEMVGHDFYLFHDSETDQPSVVYRRRGWSYGVLRLDVTSDLDQQRVG